MIFYAEAYLHQEELLLVFSASQDVESLYDNPEFTVIQHQEGLRNYEKRKSPREEML